MLHKHKYIEVYREFCMRKITEYNKEGKILIEEPVTVITLQCFCLKYKQKELRGHVKPKDGKGK